MPNNDTSIFNIGRVPKYLGDFEDNHNYRIYNIVSYVESCFISVSDNNTNVPVSLTRDSSGYLESYTLNTGWNFLMNGLDASIAMSNEIKECINAKNQAISVASELRGQIESLIRHNEITDASMYGVETAIEGIPYNVDILLPDPPEFPDNSSTDSSTIY